MPGHSGQKIRLLFLFDILKKYTDDDHPLSAEELCIRLRKLGLSAERKAIYDDISVLEEFGYNIIMTRVPKSGYFLADREFELPEISLLSDAVLSADFVSPKKTKELIHKLEDMLSEHQAKKYKKRIFIDNRFKCTNEEIYYSIDRLERAIEDSKKVKLSYYRHCLSDDNKITGYKRELVISPYALAWVSDHYYLVGNNEKYDNLIHLRLDRMKSVEITDQTSRHFSEVSRYKNYFDIADYTGKVFNMFGGEQQRIELLCSNKILEQVVDRFGEDVSVRAEGNDRFLFFSDALVSEGLIGWLMQFGNDIEVVSPKPLRDKVLEVSSSIKRIYEK